MAKAIVVRPLCARNTRRVIAKDDSPHAVAFLLTDEPNTRADMRIDSRMPAQTESKVLRLRLLFFSSKRIQEQRPIRSDFFEVKHLSDGA